MKNFTILMIGETGCGKSSVLRALNNKTFIDEMECTIGVDFHRSKQTFNDVDFTFDIYDTGGDHLFKDIISQSLNQADLVLLCYDLTNSLAIEQINKWLQIIQNLKKIIPVMIVGNKSDLLHHPNQKQLSQYFSSYQIFYTSAKTGEGVKEVFDEAYLRVINQNKRYQSSFSRKILIHEPKKSMCYVCCC